jgi:hypothetical protein
MENFVMVWVGLLHQRRRLAVNGRSELGVATVVVCSFERSL